MTSGDPVDVLTWAAESSSRSERVAGYRRVLDMLDGAGAEFDAGYVASTRARALCGLARDGEERLEDARVAVDRAVEAGAPCAALLSLAEACSALGDPDGVNEAVRRVPRACFRSPLLAMWRFRLWDLRARASFDLGRVGEGLRYAGFLIRWMDREDQRELAWVPPRRTVDALCDLVESTGPGAARARALLADMAARVDLEDWFGAGSAQRMLAVVERAELE